MNVFGCQFDIRWEDKASNFEIVSRMVRELRPAPGSLVVLPEMFATGFSMNPDFIAEPPGGLTTEFLTKIAQDHQVWILAGLALRRNDEKPANCGVVLNPQGQRVIEYQKMRLFSPGGEDKHYRAGDRPVTFKWQGMTVAPFICYDLRFPELFRAALSPDDQPELLVVIASWPKPREAHWVHLLQARAIENQAYVLGVNRIGKDPSHTYPGRSMFINPQGEIVSDAGEAPGWARGTVEINDLIQYRDRLPFLRDFLKHR